MKSIENYPRDFEGVFIPKEIYLNPNLNALDKIIFTEINSLDRHNIDGGDYWKCDKCNELIKVKIPMRYCNNCGAKMVEPQEGEGCTK